jgi:hypothetical protein
VNRVFQPHWDLIRTAWSCSSPALAQLITTRPSAPISQEACICICCISQVHRSQRSYLYFILVVLGLGTQTRHLRTRTWTGVKVCRGPAPAPLNLASYGPGSCFVGPYIISPPNAIYAYGGVCSIQKLSFRNFVGPRHLFQTTLTTGLGTCGLVLVKCFG